jgi:hypothetical protein
MAWGSEKSLVVSKIICIFAPNERNIMIQLKTEAYESRNSKGN